MEKPLRVVVVGAGRFGSLHIRTWLEAGAQIVGVVDTDARRAEEVAGSFGISQHGSDLRSVIERTSADIVVVASDESTHTVLANQALDGGCHVFVEKPFALTSAEALDTIARAERAGLHIVVGQISRFSQPYRYVREAIASGRLGALWSTRLRRDFSRSWLNDFGARVHPVWESCIHDIDLAIYFSQSRPKRVFGVQSGLQENNVPAAVSALIEFEDGSTATVESAWSVPTAAPQTIGGALALSGTIAGEAEVIGARGTVKQRLINDAISEWGESGVVVPDLSLWPDEDGRVGGALRVEVNYALQVFGEDLPNAVMPHEHALWGVQVAEALILSLSTGRPEQIGATL